MQLENSKTIMNPNMLKKSFITVIGGSGFLGTRICSLLHISGINFEIIDIIKSSVFPDHYKRADVRNLDELRATISGDIIINLAAVHSDDVKDETEYYDTNVTGARNVVEVSKEKNIQTIIFTSSVAVYGFNDGAIDEGGDINPFNAYGRSKYQAEEVFRSWNSLGDNNLVIIRPTVIFGEGNRGNVFNLFNAIWNKNFIMIGDGTNIKSMCYVENIALFITQCLECNVRYTLCNYCDGPDLTMNELVKEIRVNFKQNNKSNIRLPYWSGILLGFLADILSYIARKQLPISLIRVKKFCASSQFVSTNNRVKEFHGNFSLTDALQLTLNQEFPKKDIRN